MLQKLTLQDSLNVEQLPIITNTAAYTGRCFQSGCELCFQEFELLRSQTVESSLWPTKYINGVVTKGHNVAHIVFQLKQLVSVCMHALNMTTKLLHWHYCLTITH